MDAAERVLSYPEALAEVLKHAAEIPFPGRTEALDILRARGRVLAEPILAERDQPPFPRSTRDGFAVLSTDLQTDGTRLVVQGTIRAGERWAGAPLAQGQAIEIMTGAPLPEGADAVLMVEHTGLDADGMLRPAAGRRLQPGENIVPTGAEARQGEELVPRGRRIGVPEISLAASCGYPKLAVTPRPEVAILATGDELVGLGSRPEAWQIRNSNTYSLAALVEAEAARALCLPAARDTLEDLRARLAESEGVALLLLSGGVSMGKYDLVEEVLREHGAEFFFTGARIQPGKPVVFGRLPRQPGSSVTRPEERWTYLFGLPGNPVSTEVCFRLFVAPLLRAMTGQQEREPRFATATLALAVKGGARVTRFLPAVVESSWDSVKVRPVPWQGSGDLAANGRANGFVVVPADSPDLQPGEAVRVLLR